MIADTMVHARNLTELGRTIQAELNERRWSIRRLAEETGVDSGTISRTMRGITEPSPKTIQAIGQALGLDYIHLARLSGIPIPAIPGERDSSVEYIAQKLQALPTPFRELTFDATGCVVDTIWRLVLKLDGRTAQRVGEGRDEASLVLLLTPEEVQVLRAALNLYIELEQEGSEEETERFRQALSKLSKPALLAISEEVNRVLAET